MVKAKKRRDVKNLPPPRKKTGSRREQIFFLLILVLIVSGFTLTGMLSPTYNQPDQSNQPNPAASRYIQASFLGNKQFLITQVKDQFAVLGEPPDMLSLKNELGGDLIVIGEGATAVMVSNATEETLDAERDENSILYRVAICQADVEANCFLETNLTVNQTEFFEQYSLSNSSIHLGYTIIAFEVPALELEPEGAPEEPVMPF